MESQQSRVLVQLRDMILKGEFAPGERLAEIPVSERLQASRTPVRLALASLEHEGLIEQSPSGGYQMRRFTSQEVADAIRVRGLLEGFAARLLAENGAPRQLLRELHDVLEDGDKVVNKDNMDLDDYAAYVEMNDRFHQLIVDGCGNVMIKRVMDMLNGQPFAAASAMLPMQSSMEEGHQWMKQAHRTHHALLQAIERSQGSRAQALGEEHVEIARMNLDYALDKPELAAKIMPGIKLVADAVRSRS
ncbi:GntR family transcriptional regulator [Noviherbaspirillum cavernae]|uniref:GntR family transcriptional regulator n=1 Tax=Noviherbaspirillum cavernae TaxID=2320862 RepID=A0A418WX30_9BURK|nr:GntR family transcriptional regulator [Noviherbaspirillum cavernae]RJG04762.1 GntR family transcriptional regulator [Noviherbaspirillum cavernae]